jgi:hypothetical protein
MAERGLRDGVLLAVGAGLGLALSALAAYAAERAVADGSGEAASVGGARRTTPGPPQNPLATSSSYDVLGQVDVQARSAALTAEVQKLAADVQAD